MADFYMRVVVPSPPNSYKPTGPMRSYIEKENHISLGVSKILRYIQTDIHPVTFYIRRIQDFFYLLRDIRKEKISMGV